MTPLLWLVVKMAGLTWLALMAGSLLRARAWTPTGLNLALGNRDRMPEPSALGARAERAARNTLENLVLFAVLALVAHAAGAGNSAQVLLGAQLFFWARLAYLAVYIAGIAYLRTGVWALGMVGLAWMVAGLV